MNNAESVKLDIFTANQEMWHRAANSVYVKQRSPNRLLSIPIMDSEVGPIESAILLEIDG